MDPLPTDRSCIGPAPSNDCPSVTEQCIAHTRPNVFPIRVIDLEETLRSDTGGVFFARPTSWAFHTISHAWSKSVQSWSNIIHDKGKNTSGRSYEELFREEDFIQHPCYRHFMEFAKLLRADGVEHVWLDSLCIKQGSESEEKNQELQNMGNYYAKSLGCYVCTHGFGEGFKIWKDEPNDDGEGSLIWKKRPNYVLPRWFHRVWTFQEMLLPKKLTFIVEINRPFKAAVNYNIRKQDGVGFCRCVMEMQFPEGPKAWDVREEVVDIICEESECSKCGEVGLIRRAREREPQERDLYFIQRECIAPFMVRHMEFKGLITIHGEDAEVKLFRLKQLVLQRESLRNVEVLGAWDPIQVVWEVSWRDCTFAEDRLLSVLGLLGLEGAVQLRVGKTLDDQLVHLSQQLRSSDPTSLVKLCIAQFAGHTTAGMSWAPSLEEGLRPTGEKMETITWEEAHRSEQVYARKMEVDHGSQLGLSQLGGSMKYFVRRVEVADVLDDGSLQLSQAQVLQECRFVRVHQDLFHLDCQGDMRYSFQPSFSHSSCILHHTIYSIGRNVFMDQCMVRLQGGHELNDRLTDFQVSLVLLGELNLPGDSSRPVFMICVGENLNALHKVGIGWFIALGALCKNPPTECTVSGFVDYMDKFVLKSVWNAF